MKTETILCREATTISFLCDNTQLINTQFVETDKLTCGTTELNAYFLPRKEVETNYKYRQLIPYITLQYKNKYVLYKRTVTSDEHRLHHKYSLGVGGHINTKDICYKVGQDIIDVPTTVLNSTIRELQEEVSDIKLIYNNQKPEFTILGYIFMNDNAVNSAHLGISINIPIELDTITQNEDKLDKLQLLTISEIETYYDKLEGWSQLVYNELKNRDSLQSSQLELFPAE